MYPGTVAQQVGVISTMGSKSVETAYPSHIVKYLTISKENPATTQERAFGSAEDAESYAKALVVGCDAHPESIRIYAETGCRVVVSMEYLPTAGPAVAPRPATNR